MLAFLLKTFNSVIAISLQASNFCTKVSDLGIMYLNFLKCQLIVTRHWMIVTLHWPYSVMGHFSQLVERVVVGTCMCFCAVCCCVSDCHNVVLCCMLLCLTWHGAVLYVVLGPTCLVHSSQCLTAVQVLKAAMSARTNCVVKWSPSLMWVTVHFSTMSCLVWSPDDVT